MSNAAPMIDPFGRTIDYVRISVTDRCDLRCTYCMSEHMQFLPRADLLTFDELARIADCLIRLGTRRIRLTGGEPLVRRDIMDLVRSIGSRLGSGLDTLTLTTNGSQLARHAQALRDAGIRRINVSLDTLDPARFRTITRGGRLEATLAGIEAATAAGLSIRINTVALRSLNEDEIDAMLEWCGRHGHDLCLIETMPMGEIEEDRTDRYLPLSLVRARLERRWTLNESRFRTAGPARYVEVAETGTRLGFITPMTHSFCATCNRVRLSCTGTLFMCLGQEDSADLRPVLRSGADDAALEAAIRAAIARKPEAHDFIIEPGRTKPAVARHMSVTGG